ncbi:neurobeachin-like protein 1 isoform X2 [Contarinia nasturtii]|uniref:neurobeachin-like protein 1 isoform X2 n=1 Tax=Contarinia nasturtii TaxID=265458 RepID=UPI0012D4C208|nr:neurobeachin-like protein 1 isoform X2 [Contarinia nasturtii]
MENRKDIYNLWIQYTTKNDKSCFRQFVAGFVDIWTEQLNLDFEEPPLWNEIKNDLGPHLKRLPDELLPAIGKFLIIAKDSYQNEAPLNDDELAETTLLLKCLTMICRHFDNIQTVANYQYISCAVTISMNIIIVLFKDKRKPKAQEVEYIKSFSQLIEVIYDPYLTWRNFLHGHFADYRRILTSIVQLHVELVPFIYDCFQFETIIHLPDIGVPLVHMLGAIISGSQSNGMRAVCPATVSVLINILSKWECNAELRSIVLRCFAKMVIVLHRSNPVERQIDLLMVFQMYLDVMLILLKTRQFERRPFEEKFDVVAENDDYIDLNALTAVVDNIECILSESQSRLPISAVIVEANYIATLAGIPKRVQKWEFDRQKLAASVIKALAMLRQTASVTANAANLTPHIVTLFEGVKSLGKPTKTLIEQCIELAYDSEKKEIIFGEIVTQLVSWIKDMHDTEQLYVAESMLKICAQNISCKRTVSNREFIQTICDVLRHSNVLSSKCAIDLIKLIEELARYSISPIELKSLFYLLREKENFDYRKQLLQSLASISLQNIPSNQNICSEFLDIQSRDDGITVPDICKWTTSSAFGFIFHAWIRLDEVTDWEIDPYIDSTRYRRVIFSLLTAQGTGYEIFIDNNGKLIVAIVTKKEYFATSVSSPSLIDKKWHLITIGILPPKRPFAYTQILSYIDGHQKLGATIKFGAFTDTFLHCTIGMAYQKVRRTPNHENDKEKQLQSSSSVDSASRGMFPSLMERAFLPQIVSQVPSYFSLPLRSTSSNDPNVKCYPMGMQDGIFGPQACLRGQIGSILLAEPTTSIKTILDAGVEFSSIVSQEIEPYDLNSKYVFCFSPSACYSGICMDLVPGGKFNGHFTGNHCRTTKIQDAINSIGGICTLLPILETVVKSNQLNLVFDASLDSMAPTAETPGSLSDEMIDWEILSSNTYTEYKMIQNSVGCFLCLIRYFISNHDLNQEQFMKFDCIGIITNLLIKCDPELIDVNVLMASHLLLEAVQNQQPTPNKELLEAIYNELIFEFKIWSRAPFQVTIGHIQYINTMIKDDRKYFKKKFGIQFFLDVIRQHYAVPDRLGEEDAQCVRVALLEIIKYYIHKDLNIKEVCIIISYIASVNRECLIVELVDLIWTQMNSRHCLDQVFLLMHEPNTAELCYALLTDRKYSSRLHLTILKFLNCLLSTKRVSKKHKWAIRLHDPTIHCQTLFPGLISHMLPLDHNTDIILMMLDMALADDSGVGYCGALNLIFHLSEADIDLKLEIAKKIVTVAFNKLNSSIHIAKQIGWQDSIARLLVRKHIATNFTVEGNYVIGKDVQDNADDESGVEFAMDMLTFDEKSMELGSQSSMNNSNLLLNEIQANFTEAANVIEHEIKEMAETVSGKVAGNISSVYSMIRQKTSDIQETFESLTHGSSLSDKQKSLGTMSTLSSNSTSDENLSLKSTKTTSAETKSMSRVDSTESDSLCDNSSSHTKNEKSRDILTDENIDKEEQLIYLVTNILYTVLWHGIENNGGDSWKERGQVIACINLLGLNNELYCSHLTLRLRIFELGVQASLMDLSEDNTQNHIHQENAAQLLRMIYDLVVLDPNEDEQKKCSPKLLDGVLALMDTLMIFQQSAVDDWVEMSRICLGLLMKCSRHPNPEIVAMATARLHTVLQVRATEDLHELGYLLFSINKTLNAAIEVGDSEGYSFLMPVLKALLEKSRIILNLTVRVPDLPPTTSGPVFFNDFQMYSTSKQWTTFIENKIKPLHDAYVNEVSSTIWEQLNRFWAESYESCKASSQIRAKNLMESRKKFQLKIIKQWRLRQNDEASRLNGIQSARKIHEKQIERKWRNAKNFLNSKKGAFSNDIKKDEFYHLSKHENPSRMRLKLEPSLYHDAHTAASNLRDNTASHNTDERRLSHEFGSSIVPAAVNDIFTEDEAALLEEEMKASVEPQQQEIPAEKVVISQDCELVTLMTRVKGRLEVTSRLFSFIDLDQANEEGEHYDFKFPLSQIKEVHLRKYNLRRSALEIFLVDQTSYFLNFTTKTRNKIFSKILSLQPQNLLYGSGRSPSELLKQSGLTQKWVNREITNFEYLMQLNTIAGRSYNDLSQYPVFPWILADYSSPMLDLNDEKSFRDLSRPIGVVNPKNEDEVRAKYDGFEDPTGVIPKFHYGTHYSNSAGVLHYLIRVEPFTSLHIELQSGRFDVADRQFHSIPQTFKLLMDNPNDVKELIPEFFYFPEFLKNLNKFDLGTLQNTKERVDDVILPPWAKSPEDFISIHRRALESEYVSQNLHNWIDLIFGYKQKGPRAVEALNVFYYCSYEGAVDLDKISNQMEREAVEGMINNFGQTPSQLLREAHPKRLTQDEVLAKLYRFELKKPDVTAFLDRIAHVNCDFTSEKDPIVFLSTPRSPPRSFLQASPDFLISISRNAILGCNSWVAQEKDKGFLLEVDATTTNLKNRKRINGPFHPSINLHSRMFAVSLDGRYIYAAGCWDNSLKVISVTRGKPVASIQKHLDIITCIALDNCGSYIVTGSRDCTCIVWSISNGTLNNVASVNPPTTPTHINHHQTIGHSQMNTQNSLTPRPVNTLYGHDKPISCVAIFTELDMVVSGSEDGTVNVHTIKDGQFVRSLLPIDCSGPSINITFLALSYQGHIAFSAVDDTSHSVHVYSINGAHLGSKYVSGRVTGLTTANDYLVVADDAGDITMSRLYGLKPVFDIPLHIPIQTIVVTPGNTHLLAPLRDGKLACIGVSTPKTTKNKHSVLSV